MDKLEEMNLAEVRNDVENQLVVSDEEVRDGVVSGGETFNYSECTEGELVEKLKELLKSNPESYASIKGDVESIKQNFYRKLKTKNDELKSAFLADGGEESDFQSEFLFQEQSRQAQAQRGHYNKGYHKPPVSAQKDDLLAARF